MAEYEATSTTPAGMTEAEFELWKQLMEQSMTIQTAVTDSRKILDKLPGGLREDGINLLYERLTTCRAKLLGLAAEESEP